MGLQSGGDKCHHSILKIFFFWLISVFEYFVICELVTPCTVCTVVEGGGGGGSGVRIGQILVGRAQVG